MHVPVSEAKWMALKNVTVEHVEINGMVMEAAGAIGEV